jgi:hypothetical protein
VAAFQDQLPGPLNSLLERVGENWESVIEPRLAIELRGASGDDRVRVLTKIYRALFAEKLAQYQRQDRLPPAG